MLKDNKLTKLNITSTNQGISFTTTEQNGTYLIVENDLSSSSNSVMIVLVIIISIYIGLAVFAIISGLKHKDNLLDI